MEERIAAATLSRDQVIKHWLLNLAIELPIGLNRIFPLPNTLSLNVKAVPNANPEDYARSLIELLDSGMIVLSSEFEEDDLSTRSGISRVLGRFLALPKDYQRVRCLRLRDGTSMQVDRNPSLQSDFKLTTIGGEAWERIARPDWLRFLMERSDFEVADFYSANRDLLTAYMGWYADINEARILQDTVEWDSRADSEIVYWKKLPIVHHSFCRLQVKPPANTPKWLWEWYSSATRWYTAPWEQPNWPAE